MANAMDAYFRGMQGSMQAGQNALAMQQAADKIRQDRQLRNILAGAYEQPQAGIPAMGAAPAMGAVQPGAAPLSDYPAQAAIPAQAGGLNIENALNAMYQGGFGPEALDLQMKMEKQKGGLGTYNPRDYTPESWAGFIKTRDPAALKRYTEKTVTLGGVEHQLTPDRGYVPLSTLQDEADAAARLEASKTGAKIKTQTELAPELKFKEKLGSEGAAVYSKLSKAAQEASAFIPRLQSLKELAGKVRTGTGAEIKMIAKRALNVDSADMEVLNAKLGELAQEILNQQTGTKTDFDFENAVRQSAALGKTPKANALLIDALIKRQEQAVNFGDQAKQAYEKYGPKGVLDMRYQQPAQTSSAPKKGAVQGGYIFLGGDPAKPESWKKK